MPTVKNPRIHITAVGSAAHEVVKPFGYPSTEAMLECARRGAGPDFEITASKKMILARQKDQKGGRSDDRQRAREIENLLADHNVAAIITLRGGAWFTRIIDRINFNVLRQRKTRIYLFGFSEMTSLIAIAGGYSKAVGLYDLGPGFLYQACKRRKRKYLQAFSLFFADVAHILNGKGSKRVPTGRLLAGTLPAAKIITITGGNLSVLMPLLGSRFKKAIDTKNKWLALEDINESAERIDRMMAGLKLNGLLEKTNGIILGDFHNDHQNLSQTAFNILKHHLPAKRQIPIVQLKNFGHIHSMAPLPMHRQVTIRCKKPARGKPHITIEIPWAKWARH
ncbi:MAG: LD-carboxypeptidase [Planctomycetota bacterium]